MPAEGHRRTRMNVKQSVVLSGRLQPRGGRGATAETTFDLQRYDRQGVAVCAGWSGLAGVASLVRSARGRGNCHVCRRI